uniref:dolichyl-diphosphooligosaccharide--protein glycotransferase n=1 Tax=Phaeomonas parva TaxID=124430 RepID=A0A7S1U4D8_9STRA|mmetsp:Transcript_30451/g.97154  ORF Transcript_30451/g.97154 Transcript_30451/m.97154 type:complete len:901 (+) Transcript_30451:187-2889(+)
MPNKSKKRPAKPAAPASDAPAVPRPKARTADRGPGGIIPLEEKFGNGLPKAPVEELHEWSKVYAAVTLGMICALAFFIRLFAVVRYESVIHEFDPYFNFRTTKYLASEGFMDFLNWFDDRGWYPLGRTIGGTIYPGLMYTAAVLYWLLNFLNISVNIRNMCVFLAPLFAANTALAAFFLTKEVTRRTSASLLAAAFIAIVPSYISRSVGGSYDNEGVAIFALLFVFYLWIKAVHTGSMLYAAATALAYFYMVAAWGGYVFIINMIPIHTVVLVVAGRFSKRLYVAYSIFYVIGSICAMMVPFVGFNVVQQAECAASHGVFVGLQVYAIVSHLYRIVDARVLRRVFVVGAAGLVGAFGAFLIALQLTGKVQWTGRSLTLLDPTYATKYIPIIASVSEHQPTTWTSFFFDLHVLVPLAPVGLYFLFDDISDGGIFVILYGTVAWYFAGVMVRLMLTLAPIACILSAIGISKLLQRFSSQLVFEDEPTSAGGGGGGKAKPKYASLKDLLNKPLQLLVLLGCTGLLGFYGFHATYVSSMAYSSPSIVIEAGRMANGARVLYDDYREAYYWLRHNTHPDAKIASWWDYGYQMSAMANRTVLVDNNTWNNTHIATVGRMLASTEDKALPILRSLDVDYVLVIFGGLTGYSSDDVNKFLWPVRIGSGVYPNDMPSEREFLSPHGGFDIGPGASKTFKNCVLYKLCYYRFGEVQTDYSKPPGYDRSRNKEVGDKDIKLKIFHEAFTSEHWIVRIYKVKTDEELENFTPTENIKEVRKLTSGSASSKKSKDKDRKSGPVFVGCFSDENMFQRRKYVGGSTGANFNLLKYHAENAGSRYFAVARNVNDGHAFTFDLLSGGGAKGDLTGGGCDRPCLDEQTPCGCTDTACTAKKVPNPKPKPSPYRTQPQP